MSSTAIQVWAQFALCAAVIGWGGARLSRYGDVIAEKTRLGGTWIGLILLATVTSLPELVTGASAVTVAEVPNIAIGDALGSCVFNLLIIVVLDFLHRHEPVFTKASQGHLLAAGFGVILIGLVGFNLMLRDKADAVAIGHIGLYTPIIVVLYVIAMRMIYRYEQRQIARFIEAAADRYPDVTLRQAVFGYTVAAAIVVAAGVWLPFLGADLAQAMGWHKTFVGTLFVALATSVPELVVTITAARLGALDMAIGNLLGSNLFDVLIIAVDDALYLKGPILSQVSPLHALSAVSAIVMTGVVIVGLIYRPTGRILRTVGWSSLFLFTIYLLNAYLIYLHGE